MKRVLITGLSGTGKSTVIERLSALGYKAIDADSEEWSMWTDEVMTPPELGPPVEEGRDWVWREDRIAQVLTGEDGDILFLAGCAENMGKFIPRFDHVILLSAPPELMAERLQTRDNNPYGKHPDELKRVLDQVETIELLLRARADLEIDTVLPLDQVMEEILNLAFS